MNSDERNSIYQRALSQYGASSQITMVFEETGELIDALSKYIRGRNDKSAVITELADVSIMVEQMALLFGQNEFNAEKDRKLNRLSNRLKSKESKIPAN